MLTLFVALAAGAGAVARYVVDQVVQHRVGAQFPYGTMLINVTGSLLLGVITGVSIHHGLPNTPTIVVGVGFAGGYTTLSTWAWESLALAEGRNMLEASLNVVGSFAIGLGAAAIGLAVALV